MKTPIQSISKGWGEINGIQAPRIIREFGGINKLDAFSIEDKYVVTNKNISSRDYPTASVREGTTIVGSSSGVTNGLMAWKENELHSIVSGTWRKWNGSSWVNVLTGLNVNAKTSFTNFKGNFSDFRLLVANGIDPVKMYDGTTVTDLTAPAGMNFICSHDNRVYGAVKNALHYSALRKANDWNTVDESGQIWIEAGGGEDISCLVAGTGHVVAFTKHSTHELYGTQPNNYRLQVISEEIGCVSHHSAVMVGAILFFLSHDGLYRYAGGATPKKDYSLPVQYIVDRVNKNAWDKVVAGTDGERYYVSLPIDGATKPNITLEYDPKYQTWNIWDFGYSPTAYTDIKDLMYVGFEESRIVKVEGSTDNGAAIPFLLETKPFTYGSLAADNRLYRLWVVADIPTGATLNVYISNHKDANDWTLVKTITASNELKSTQIFIPVSSSFHHKMVRVKLEGTGAVKIHELTRQERTFRLGIGGA